MSYALGYAPCFKYDKKDVMCSMCELTYHRNKQIVKEESKPSYCKYCFNARVYKPTEEEMMDPFITELTDENDFSSCGVGQSSMGTRFMITSGHGEPVRIEIDKFLELRQEWVTVGIDTKTNKVVVSINPKFFRPTEVTSLCGDSTKAKTILGWNPSKTSFRELVSIMSESDKKKVETDKIYG